MEAIILVGGFGTRLSHIVSEVPKPMAPVNGSPLLKYIMDYLGKNGITHVVFAAGYKAQVIQNYFEDCYQGIKIIYSIEDMPLGTGGAIKKALDCCNEKNVFIINGDTYFDVDLKSMKNFHAEMDSSLTIAVKPMSNFERYGSVIIENRRIVKFEEKRLTASGKINGGIYVIKKEILDGIEKVSFSFENDILEGCIVDIHAFESNGYFIDIGVPEDYYKAQEDFASNRL